MTSDAEDRSTWPRNGQVIRRDELLRLIEENGGPNGLDLRGVVFVGDGPTDDASSNPIDLSPDALAFVAEAYRQTNGGRSPPWIIHWGGISLEYAQLGQADLRNAQLRQAFLGGTHLQGAKLAQAHMHGAVLYGAELQQARLAWADLRAAEFADTNLQGADLTHARLQRTDLALCQLKAADLRDAELQGADMYEVTSLDGAHWYGANLDHTRIKRETLGEAIGDELKAHGKKTARAYHEAKEACLLLKNNFNQIGRYEDASWAYVKERCMERKALYQEHRWWIWPPKRWVPKSWKSWWRWVLAWATEALTNYGQDPWRPIVWAVALALGLFPLLFWTAGNLHHQDGTSITAYWDAMAYSLTTFGTLSFNDLQPVGIGTRIISAIEAFTGVLLFALVVFTLGNKMSRG